MNSITPLHEFTSHDLCQHIEAWICDDINHKNNLSETKQKFTKRVFDGRFIVNQPLDTIRDILQIDLKPLMTKKTLKIIVSYCKKWKQENVDHDIRLQSAQQIADILYNYPLKQLLKRIENENIDGARFIQSVKCNEDIIVKETGWNKNEANQIHSILFRYHSFTELQFEQNMNYILHHNYRDVLSANIIKNIKQIMIEHDAPVINCNIKNAQCIDEFSDSVINIVDEYAENKHDEFIMQIYEAIAECFIYRENYESKHKEEEHNNTIMELQHWICNNCGNCNVNTCIDNKFTTNVIVCTLCGMSQRDQIVLKLRNHDSYIMVNNMDTKVHEIENKESDDPSLDRLISNVIKIDGWFNLLCPNHNSCYPCKSILRLTKQLIKYKRWLCTIHREKGSCDIDKTVKVNIAKYIANDVYKETFVVAVKQIELMTAKHMNSIIEFIERDPENLLDADMYLNKDTIIMANHKKAFSIILKTHIDIPESCGNKLYNLIKKALQLKEMNANKIDHCMLKRIFIAKTRFIHNQTKLLIAMFELNAENIADIKVFATLRAYAFSRIVRDNTSIDIPTGSKLYRAIKGPLYKTAQRKQFGHFLCDLDITKIQKDYHHIRKVHIDHGNKESIKNVYRFFHVLIHYDDNEDEKEDCRSMKRNEERLKKINTKHNTHNDEIHENVQQQDEKDIFELNQHYVQSQLDVIHCHLSHSNVLRALKRKSNKHKDDENDEKHDEECTKHKYDHSKFTTKLSESDNTDYGFGINHHHPYLKPVHDSIHDELLMNKLSYRLSVKQFQSALVKAIKKQHLSDLKCKYYQKKYNIIRNECIGLRHIFSLIVYADCGPFCTMLRKTYRRFRKESTQNVTHRHQQLYFFARSLYEAVEFFGKDMQSDLKVYHGLDRILLFSQFTAYFHQPISTTFNIHVANTFSNGTGFILLLRAARNASKTHKKPKYLSISWLSCFPDEDEYLFYGQHTEFNICNIYNVEHKQFREHSQALDILNTFQKVVNSEAMAWKQNNGEIKSLVTWIHSRHNCNDMHSSNKTMSFEEQLFNYFCENQRQIRINNVISLPVSLRKALFTNQHLTHVSFVSLTKLFINIQSIEFNELDIDYMTAAADHYIQSVLHFAKNSKNTNLERIIFKSKPQPNDEQNATLQNKVNACFKQYLKYEWVVYYELSAQNTHNLSFRTRKIFINASIASSSPRSSISSVTHPSATKWDSLPTYYMQVTLVDQDGFIIEVTANTIANNARKLYIKDVKRPTYKRTILIEKGEESARVYMDIDKHERYCLALYYNQSWDSIPNLPYLTLKVIKDPKQIPPNNKQYKPSCVDVRALFQVKDNKSKTIYIYWMIPTHSFGKISYKIIKDTDKHQNQAEIISSLPYCIPFHLIPSIHSLRVITISEVEGEVYESNASEYINIEFDDTSDRDKWCKGTKCEIYSRSNKQWCDGKIIGVLKHGRLKVRYNVNNKLNKERIMKRSNLYIQPASSSSDYVRSKQNMVHTIRKSKDGKSKNRSRNSRNKKIARLLISDSAKMKNQHQSNVSPRAQYIAQLTVTSSSTSSVKKMERNQDIESLRESSSGSHTLSESHLNSKGVDIKEEVDDIQNIQAPNNMFNQVSYRFHKFLAGLKK